MTFLCPFGLTLAFDCRVFIQTVPKRPRRTFLRLSVRTGSVHSRRSMTWQALPLLPRPTRPPSLQPDPRGQAGCTGQHDLYEPGWRRPLLPSQGRLRAGLSSGRQLLPFPARRDSHHPGDVLAWELQADHIRPRRRADHPDHIPLLKELRRVCLLEVRVFNSSARLHSSHPVLLERHSFAWKIT